MTHISTSQASLPCSDGPLEQLLTYRGLPKSPTVPSLSMVPYWDFHNYVCNYPTPSLSELELQLPAYATAIATRDPSQVCDLRHSSQQRWILNSLNEARDRTHILTDVISGS